VYVDAGVDGGQATLGAGQLQPGQHLVGRFVAAQLGFGGVPRCGVCELVDPRLELGQAALERVEAVALDARARPDREGPVGYRWSIGT
jgi:hypothetical protein